MEDFDQYLSGKMDAEGRRRFEQKIATDPALQAELRVREGLRQLRLEAKVAQASTARREWERHRNWRRILVGCAIAGLFGLAVFVWVKKEPLPPTPPATQWPNQEAAPTSEPLQPTDEEEIAPVLPEKKTTEPIQQPIAEAKPNLDQLPPPADFPNLRGEDVEAYELKKLLDQVWYAQYPPAGFKLDGAFEEADALLMGREYEKAYGKLQRLERKLPDNDTLRMMKGFCLMYMGEGTEAIRYFDAVGEQPLPTQQLLEWYRGQCLLLSGKREDALVVFRKIAADPKHSYQRQGKTAVRFLE
ncbi:MAG: hypothetical protein IPN76_00955 [Saprospiraceae bacterium]|nr:hypothetical protein [Saprospiraceae bacterium]